MFCRWAEAFNGRRLEARLVISHGGEKEPRSDDLNEAAQNCDEYKLYCRNGMPRPTSVAPRLMKHRLDRPDLDSVWGFGCGGNNVGSAWLLQGLPKHKDMLAISRGLRAVRLRTPTVETIPVPWSRARSNPFPDALLTILGLPSSLPTTKSLPL